MGQGICREPDGCVIMAGTLQSIARLIRDGHLIIAECPARLGITREQLDNRLQLMERQGYVACGRNPLEGAGCARGGYCSACPKKDATQSPSLYTLTEKGERLISATGLR